MEDVLEGEVRVSLGDVYIKRIALFLEEIDKLKKKAATDADAMYSLNNTFHSFYKFLYPKLNKDEIDTQNAAHKTINEVPAIIKKRSPVLGFHQEGTNINKASYERMEELLDYREIHINIILERLGLTNKTKTKKIEMR